MPRVPYSRSPRRRGRRPNRASPRMRASPAGGGRGSSEEEDERQWEDDGDQRAQEQLPHGDQAEGAVRVGGDLGDAAVQLLAQRPIELGVGDRNSVG